MNGRYVEGANSTTVYIYFLSFSYNVTHCLWFLFGFIKGLSMWKGVGLYPIEVFIVWLWEKKLFVGNVTLEIWLWSVPVKLYEEFPSNIVRIYSTFADGDC